MTNPQAERVFKMLAERGRCLWSVPGPKMADGPSKLEAWWVPGRKSIVIVHVMGAHGIDLYSNDSPHSWDEIERWLDGDPSPSGSPRSDHEAVL